MYSRGDWRMPGQEGQWEKILRNQLILKNSIVTGKNIVQ
jgi:hypothetical protein